jgi:expansin (peptidoglycan-binding protein)
MEDQHKITLHVAQALFSNSISGGQITITNTQNQQTVTAAIADQCARCNTQSLDLSEGVFQKIGNEAQGQVPSACLSRSAI